MAMPGISENIGRHEFLLLLVGFYDRSCAHFMSQQFHFHVHPLETPIHLHGAPCIAMSGVEAALLSLPTRVKKNKS